MRVLRIVLAALLLLQQCTAKCSVAEQKCGTLCCCVTCKCHEEPHRCEDMWGKPTDPVGTEDDERFATPEWSKARHGEHLERHREFERLREDADRLLRDDSSPPPPSRPELAPAPPEEDAPPSRERLRA